MAYLDYTDRKIGHPLDPLPSEGSPFAIYFPAAGIHIKNTEKIYTVANLSKGGVTKVFRQE